MKALAAGLLAAAALAVPEAWLHNARERTGEGRAAWERGDFQAAARALDQALELGGEGAAPPFNAGTGHLAAGTPGTALSLLQRAADAAAAAPAGSADAALRPDALYNLGNAQLATGNAEAAADAYRAALRLAPDHLPAKHNLELALKRSGQPSPQQSPGGQGDPRPGDQQPQPQSGDGEGRGQPQPQQPGAQGGPPQQPPPPLGPRSPRLPRFDPQQDMSAEQAANLLEAVENLEREQRRAQAEEGRRQRARESTEKDW